MYCGLSSSQFYLSPFLFPILVWGPQVSPFSHMKNFFPPLSLSPPPRPPHIKPLNPKFIPPKRNAGMEQRLKERATNNWPNSKPIPWTSTNL